MDWWLMDWWLMVDKWWLMIDGWWLMLDGWWLKIDDWWSMLDDWGLIIDDAFWVTRSWCPCAGPDHIFAAMLLRFAMKVITRLGIQGGKGKKWPKHNTTIASATRKQSGLVGFAKWPNQNFRGLYCTTQGCGNLLAHTPLRLLILVLVAMLCLEPKGLRLN